MLNIISNGKNSMNAQQKKLDIISNNIANVETVGYKKNRVEFQDLLSDTFRRRGIPINEDREGDGIYTSGTGVRVTDIKRDYSQGMLKDTGVKTDYAIDGEGMFEIMLPDGSKGYTRDGSFKIDAFGNLTDSNGNRVVINDSKGNNINVYGGKIDFTKGNLKTDLEGNVFLVDGLEETELGKISVKEFTGDTSLVSIGENLFIPQDGATAVEGKNYTILNGFLETSNVRMEDEMTDMIVTQRAFQVNATSIKTADQMWGLVNDMFR